MEIEDPEVLEFISRTELFYPSDSNLMTVEENRNRYDEMCREMRSSSAKEARLAAINVSDFDVGGVSVRGYLPSSPCSMRVLYSHGGGFVLGSLESHDDICTEIAIDSGCEVWSSDYRLSPEHVYPSALDDVETVWRAMSQDGVSGVVVGDSAGGNLSASLCLRMRRLDGPQPLAQILIYPGLGGDKALPSRSENAFAPLLRTVDLDHYAKIYGSNADKDDPEAFPLRAKNFSGLPPAVIFTADIDPLRDDGFEYCRRLNRDGVNAKIYNELQLVHGYLRGRTMSKRAATSFKNITRAISSFIPKTIS